MVWAPDSPDLWAPDSATPNRWAPDSGGHLTLGRAVDLFLAAKAAEGAAAKTLEWYGTILRRAVRGLGEERPIEQLAGRSFGRLSEIGDRTRLTVEQLVGAAAERLATSPPVMPSLAATAS